MKKHLFIAVAATLFFSGCGVKNALTIGYENSVCEQGKKFGVCGNPKSVLKYKQKIKEVQDKYLHSGIRQTLYFGVDDNGNILVKHKREGKWKFYETSRWKRLIEEKYRKKIAKLKEIERKTREARPVSYDNDLPVTEGNDLSIIYQKQGGGVVTRTKIGDIIRDSGRIQKVFIANYVDPEGDLVAGHEVYVVVKKPRWIVGERTPKHSFYKDKTIPTPLSEKLLDRQNRTSRYQEDVVNSYVDDTKEGVMKAVKNDPEEKWREEEQNMKIIKEFIKTERGNKK